MTVVEVLKWASEKLKNEVKDASDSSMLDAQVLLAAVLDVPTSWLFTHFDKTLEEKDLDIFRQMIKRRLANEPIAYITGEKEFYKRNFFVNSSTLIPRPATETLVEAAIKIAHEETGQVLFADIGTGSGAIAITLAAETGLPVIASDISSPALLVAQKNAEANKVAELVDLRQGDLLEPLVKIFQAVKKTNPEPICEHLIVCANLPYLTAKQWANTALDVREYEPKSALEAGVDGLDLYWRLIREIKQRRDLFPVRLTLLLEIDPDQKQKIASLIKRDFPLSNIIVLRDLDDFDRIAVANLNAL
ncbi:MAG: peptide chain release factor N(5)-glutamine methyltransferase [Patescibacteria group bacterium]|jgi:release factor glutamine methyltransferase